MKKIFFLAGIVIFVSTSLLAQQQPESKKRPVERQPSVAPENVKQAFRSQYPDIKDVEWKRNNRQWRARHKGTDKNMYDYYYYDENGNMVDTHNDVSSNNVPGDVDKNFHDRYGTSQQYSAVRIQRKGEPDIYQLRFKSNGKDKVTYVDEHGKDTKYSDRH